MIEEVDREQSGPGKGRLSFEEFEHVNYNFFKKEKNFPSVKKTNGLNHFIVVRQIKVAGCGCHVQESRVEDGKSANVRRHFERFVGRHHSHGRNYK